MQNINIFALGGQDENGKNSLVVEVEQDIFIVNAGIMLPINGRYGIDGIIPEFKYLVEHKDRVRGLFITHAHDECFAALPWLLMEFPGIPIYGSRFTIEVAKDRVAKYRTIQNRGDFRVIDGDIKAGEVNVKSFAVASSILGAYAYNFQTTTGDIIVMSNLVNDDLGVFGKTDLELIKQNSQSILALCLDARTAHYNGSSRDKKSVKPFIRDHFVNAKSDERIIVGSYDEEMFNLQEVMELADEFKRPVISYGRNFDFLYKELRADASVISPEFVDYQKIPTTKNAVVLVTGSWSRIYQRFMRIAEGNDVYLKLRDTDHIVMMAPPLNGMEVEYSQMLDEVAKSAPNILDITENDLYQLRPAKQDIFDIVKLLRPKYFLPLSALFRYLSVGAKQATLAGVTQDRTIILVNGRIAHFIDGKLASQKAKLKDYGDVLIDGFGVGDISSEVIRERQALAAGGLVSISFNYQKSQKKIVGDMVIQVVGVVVKAQLVKVQEAIRTIILQKLNEMEVYDYKLLQNNIRKRVHRVLMKLIEKEPLTIITINEF